MRKNIVKRWKMLFNDNGENKVYNSIKLDENTIKKISNDCKGINSKKKTTFFYMVKKVGFAVISISVTALMIICIILYKNTNNRDDKNVAKKMNSKITETISTTKEQLQYSDSSKKNENLDNERDNNISIETEQKLVQDYYDIFLEEYVDCLKKDTNKSESLLNKIKNNKLKKYILYTISNKSYVTMCNPRQDTKCLFKNKEIKKINDNKICIRGNVIFVDESAGEKSGSSGMGYASIVLSKGRNGYIVEDLYWENMDSPDELYRKEFNPYENYQDFWNNKDEVKLFFGKLRIGD